MELINSFKKYLTTIVPDIVFKSVTQANANETSTSRLAGDQYVEAKLNTGNFDTIATGTIPLDILHKVGIFDEYVIKMINENKYVIPDRLHKSIWELHRQYVIDNYEEQNNYYRMLYGLPNIGNNDIYISPSDLATFGYTIDSQDDYDNDRLENLTPLHKLPSTVLLSMEVSGYLDELYNEYSSDPNYDARYIKHLGLKKIEPVIARMAGQYELLYVPITDNATRFTRDFTNYYEEARQYFLNQIYNFHYNTEYKFYEGYIGFFIMVMAIQRTINSLFEVVVQRDFYDIETCRTFLEAYGVPFVKTFTFNQQITLVKNLNILLMEKCTTTVLYDLLDILEYDRFNLSKYLLVKQHKTVQAHNWEEPRPFFSYKTILDEKGSFIYELNKSNMYDYYFIKNDINDVDTTLVDINDPSSFQYKEITEDDAFWIEDDELIEKLQQDEINFVETKYAAVSITKKMYEIVFEHVYLQKMICDKGSETSKIMLEMPLINKAPLSLLEIEVVLICLLCRYNHISPDLLISPSKQLAVLGFNFDADLEAIKKDILDHPRIYSPELVKYIDNIVFNSVSDVNKMYGNVRTLATMLIEGMDKTNSEQVYHAYRKLYNVLLITDVHNEVFTLSNGELPISYLDWLNEKNNRVYNYIIGLDRTEILDKINYITTKMISWFTNAKYLDYLNPDDTEILHGILKILRWFKSYTIEIKDIDVIFIFDSKYHTAMKMLSRMWFHEHITVRELDLGFHEWVQSISKYLKFPEFRNTFLDVMKETVRLKVKDNSQPILDKLKFIEKNERIYENFEVTDLIQQISKSLKFCESDLPMIDCMRTNSSFNHIKQKDMSKLHDLMKKLSDSIRLLDTQYTFHDSICITDAASCNEKHGMHDNIQIIV